MNELTDEQLAARQESFPFVIKLREIESKLINLEQDIDIRKKSAKMGSNTYVNNAHSRDMKPKLAKMKSDKKALQDRIDEIYKKHKAELPKNKEIK